MSPRVRVLSFVVVVAVILAATLAYLLRSRATQEGHGARSAQIEEVPLARVEAVPRIVFRNTSPGADFGHVALVPRDHPRGPRAITSMVCDRVAATAQETACLRAGTGITSSYAATVLRSGQPLRTDDRPGIPSRVRLSPGGTLVATTAFVAGDSYTSAQFSTRTFITPVAGGRPRHVEDFQLVHLGRKITPVDRNYWGVTFLDEDTFYVTVSFSGHTWLARGSVADQTIRTVHETAECPSVSPDHARVAYKKRQHDGTWRVAVLDVDTDRETVLPGGRSVDDQVSWLGDDTLLYALPRTGSQSGQADVWAVAADGTSSPRLLIREAASPTVVD